MRIGLVCPYDITKNGGVQEVLKALRELYIAKGHQAYIIAPRLHRFSGSLPKGVILVGIAGNIKALHTTSQLSISFDPSALDELLERERFDVLHFHEPWVPILARQILAKSKAANVATFHAKMPDGVMIRTIERVVTPYTKSVLKNLNVLTAVSNSAADYVRSLTDRKVEIIPNGIDLSKYKARSAKLKAHSKKTILFVGRLEKRKGPKYLLKAFANLKQQYPDIELKLAGDGPDRLKLESYVRDRNIQNVEFLGFISEKTKIKLLQESDLFCSPAIHGESFGIVLIEAMASGCVTVAGNNPGYESVLSGDGQISLVNPRDTKEFARRLEILLFNEQLRNNWRKWAVSEVKKYDYKQVANQYLAAYKKARL